MMTIVERDQEHKYPPFVWAKSIQVKVVREEIEISGVVPVGDQDYSRANDPLRAYRQAMARYSGAKRQGKNSPHVEFANADTVQKQILFLRRYGPVLVGSMRKEERAVRSEGPFDFELTETVMFASQNAAELLREHLIYRSAWVLVSELHSGDEPNVATIRKCISTIVSNVSEWPAQWERERRLRASGLGYADEPHWTFSKQDLEQMEHWMWNAEREPSGDPLRDLFAGPRPPHCGHLVICQLLNAFKPLVYPWGDTPVEAPDWEIQAGIRPVLYYMLRREYLRAGGIGICRNSDCRHIFEIERSGQEFCGEECSRLQRQRDYWSIRGKKLRERRIKERDHSSSRTKRRKER
jgi:hypothetical protein